jgi:hypothetical protein
MRRIHEAMVMTGLLDPDYTQADAVAAYKLRVKVPRRQTVLCVSAPYFAELKHKYKQLPPAEANAKMKADIRVKALEYMDLLRLKGIYSSSHAQVAAVNHPITAREPALPNTA